MPFGIGLKLRFERTARYCARNPRLWTRCHVPSSRTASGAPSTRWRGGLSLVGRGEARFFHVESRVNRAHESPVAVNPNVHKYSHVDVVAPHTACSGWY